MGLVNGDEGGLAFGEHLGEAGDAHALWCNEEELESAVEIVAAGLAGLVAGEAGMDAGDAEASGRELGGLVVHKGNQRADDESCPPTGDSGELIAETLAGSGRHDEENVATVSRGAADSLLVGTKGGEAERLMK